MGPVGRRSFGTPLNDTATDIQAWLLIIFLAHGDDVRSKYRHQHVSDLIAERRSYGFGCLEWHPVSWLTLMEPVSAKDHAKHTLCRDRASCDAVGYLTESWICIHHFCRHCLGAKCEPGDLQGYPGELHTFVCFRLLKNAVILTNPTL